MFYAASPTLPRPREEVPCVDAGGAPVSLLARFGGLCPAGLPCTRRPGFFSHSHGRPSARALRSYSARTASLHRFSTARSASAAHSESLTLTPED